MNYQLNQEDYTISNSLLWGNFSRHLEKARTGSLGNRAVELLIVAAESLPILSQISSILEWLFVSCFGARLPIIYKENETELLNTSESLFSKTSPKTPRMAINSPIVKAPIASPSIYHPFNLINMLLFIPHELATIECLQERYPHLTECRCEQIVPIRASLENASIERISHIYPTNRSKPLHILSVGAGNCYQEIVYIIKLIEKGYKNIQLSVIEPEPIDDSVEDVHSFMRDHFPDVTFSISYSHTIEDYKATHCGEKADLVLLIDLQGEFDANYTVPILTARSYQELHGMHLIEDNATIAFTTPPEDDIAIPYCCQYSIEKPRLGLYVQAVNRVSL
ncbi:MAG: hypothetical protein HY860_04245 [Chlamydiales bacterium]|nr:hypothetical protein [Chlamydiales bacterium]